jgi:outer membrane receptor protein involved in Fe transport
VTPVGLATDLIAIESAPSLAPVDEQQGAGDPRAVGSDPEGGGGVSLVIVDQRSAYELQDSSGATVDGVPASAARRWQLTLATRNLLDETYLVTGNSAFETAAAYVEQVYGRPREFLVSLSYEF